MVCSLSPMGKLYVQCHASNVRICYVFAREGRIDVDCLAFVVENAEDCVWCPFGQCPLVSHRAVRSLPLPSVGTDCQRDDSWGNCLSVSRTAHKNTNLNGGKAIWGQGQNSYVAIFLLQCFQKCSWEKHSTCFLSYLWCSGVPPKICIAKPYAGGS